MAQVTITFGKAGVSSSGEVLPLIDANSMRSEKVTVGGASVQGNLVADDGESLFIVALDLPVYFAVGQNPDALANEVVGIPAGGTFAVGNIRKGWKVAVVEVT